MEFTPLQVFSPCFHKYQPISSNFPVFNFLLWKHAVIKDEKACGKLLTHFLFFSFYVFSFLTYLVWLYREIDPTE